MIRRTLDYNIVDHRFNIVRSTDDYETHRRDVASLWRADVPMRDVSPLDKQVTEAFKDLDQIWKIDALLGE